MSTVELAARPQWQALQRHAAQIGHRHLREFFADDPKRGERFSAEAAGLYLDYAKQRVDAETIGLLDALAQACGLPQRIAAMFRGDAINTSEDRPALHVALRAPRGAKILVRGHDVVPDVHAVLDRMAALGAWTQAQVHDARIESVAARSLQPPLAAALLAERLHAEQPGARRIATTIDAGLQHALEGRVTDYLARLPERTSAALLVVDNATLEARAYVGSAAFGPSVRMPLVPGCAVRYALTLL